MVRGDRQLAAQVVGIPAPAHLLARDIPVGVIEHRINLTLYKIDKVVSGEALDEFVDALTAADQAEKLATLE